MKKLLFAIIIASLVFTCKPEEPSLPPNVYQVNVTAKGVYNGLRGHIGIRDERLRPIYTDTAMVANELMTFNGKIQSPVFRLLSINGVEGSFQFVLEPGITNIEVYKDSMQTSVVTGGRNNELLNEYKKDLRSFSLEVRDLRSQAASAARAQDTARYHELHTESADKAELMKNFGHDFIAKYPNEDFSLLLLETMLLPNQDIDKIKESMALLESVMNKNQANTLLGRKVLTYIQQQEAVANVKVGKVAPDFSAPTPEGDMLALSDIKGKATIIDFWASWCGPCRRENPNVVRIYEKYHDKGLEIIGVSLDRENQKQRWIDAIEKDNLTWHQVSNLQYFSDPIARLYNVKGIPDMFVLDENGVIVAKKLRGQALEDQIAKMLD